MLYMIGLGLSENDIGVRALEIVKKCKAVYLESYTSRLIDLDNLKKLIKKDVILANRELVEKKPEDTILQDASKENVAFLVIGDVFAATTHVDLMLRAKKKKIKVKVIHNSSVLTAVGITGLSLYKFGKVTSIPFEYENIKAPIEVINENKKMHTLILLDLDPEHNKYLTINEALTYLLKGGMKDRLCVGVSALGSNQPEIKVGKASELEKIKFKKYPQSLIVVGDLHFKEEEALKLWKR